MKIKDLSKHIEPEVFSLLCEQHCEACKGQRFMNETGCYESCDGFQSEVAIEILGLSEYHDSITHCEAPKAEAICLFLQKLAEEKLAEQ